MNKFEQTKL